MSGIKWTWNEPGIVQLLADPVVGRMVDDAVDKAAAIARGSAHRGFMNYASQFVATRARLEGDVWRGYIGNTSSGWHLVEFGTATTPPYRVLSNAVEQSGARFIPA